MAPVVIPKILLRFLAKLSAYLKTPVGVPFSYSFWERKDKKLIINNQTFYTLFNLFFAPCFSLLSSILNSFA
jgi:hypothetical protein